MFDVIVNRWKLQMYLSLISALTRSAVLRESFPSFSTSKQTLLNEQTNKQKKRRERDFSSKSTHELPVLFRDPPVALYHIRGIYLYTVLLNSIFFNALTFK